MVNIKNRKHDVVAVVVVVVVVVVFESELSIVGSNLKGIWQGKRNTNILRSSVSQNVTECSDIVVNLKDRIHIVVAVVAVVVESE